MKQFSNIAIELDNYILYLFVLILPVFYFSQLMFATVVVILILIVKAVKIALTGKVTLSKGSFDLPVILVSISYILSTIFVTPDKMAAFVSPATTSLIVLGTIIYFLVNQINLDEKRNITYFLFGGIVIYSIFILLSATKIITGFSVDGSFLESSLFIAPIIPILVGIIFKQKDFAYKFFAAVSLLITLFALLISIFSTKINYPSFKVSLNIATNVLKQNPILGIGSSNYLEGFNKYRPIDYNKTNIWSNKFTQGSSFLITNLTETGIFGSALFLTLIAFFVKFTVTEVKNRRKVGWGLIGLLDLLSIALSFTTLIIFPSFPIQIFTLFLILGIISESKRHEYIMPTKIASLFILLPLFVLISLISYNIYVLGYAEYNFQKSLKTVKNGKAKETYNLLQKAISLNSKVDRYHQVLSSVNFAIANSLSQKKEITDNEKNQITLLVQESINEAKAAVALNNKKSENWEFLGRTYHLLIPFAKGSDQFAINSYKEAVALDPINPSLRIKLGEVYMLQKDYKNAIETFKLAVLAKDDHPNAHFNLSLAYKESGDTNNAKIELNKTLSLLPNNPKDYETAKKELDKLNNPIEPLPSPIPEIESLPEVSN